eukprot:TRINITY_DN4719_c0_g1_i1.p1 TRINITY_DN4719_c0_g1~~TRINITY_DN4719_c0_g1_i1.p1  ORF type:complete len:433 (+),score=104.92 TRINITY_DN4719_c0_g1_i1:90-1388(+)
MRLALEIDETYYWWIAGVLLSATGSILINIGTNMMKYSHAYHDNLAHKKSSVLHQPMWLTGISIFCIGNIVNFWALSYSAQSMLAAVGSIQFLTNLVFAAFLFKEKIQTKSYIGTLLIISGNVLIVFFATHEASDYGVDQLFAMYLRKPFAIYLILCYLSAGSLYIAHYWINSKLESNDISSFSSWVVIFVPVSYAAFSALIGTQSVILGKSMSVLLRSTLTGDNQLNHYFTWAIVALFIFLSAFWIYQLNRALKLYSSMFIVPALQGMWIIFSILSGGIYFEEFVNFSVLQMAMFTLGVTLLIGGVVLMSPAPAATEKANDELEEFEMEPIELGEDDDLSEPAPEIAIEVSDVTPQTEFGDVVIPHPGRLAVPKLMGHSNLGSSPKRSPYISPRVFDNPTDINVLGIVETIIEELKSVDDSESTKEGISVF